MRAKTLSDAVPSGTNKITIGPKPIVRNIYSEQEWYMGMVTLTLDLLSTSNLKLSN
jgi:hypothetical protein